MNTIQSSFWAVRDYLAPVLKESKFKEHGRITPEEFVAAGEFLTYKFPVWSWQQGDPSKIRDFLPADKQYLITRNVPCLRRAKNLDYAGLDEDTERMVSMLDEADEAPAGGADEDWVETHSSTHPSASTLSAGGAGGAHGSDDIPEIPDLDPDAAADSDSAAAAAGGRHSAVPDEPSLAALTLDDQSAHAVAGGDDDVPDMDDIPDMDDDGTDGFGGGLMDDEEDAATARAPPAAGGAAAAGEDDGNLLAVRTYDVMITYDKYYQTPRVWLLGYSPARAPLTQAETFEDIPADHAHKTVTYEVFPHSGLPLVSVHPCKHASVMKKVIERMGAAAAVEQQRALATTSSTTGVGAAGDGKKRRWLGLRKASGLGGKEAADPPDAPKDGDDDDGLQVDFYLVIFLKFIASIVPTIEVDSTTAF